MKYKYTTVMWNKMEQIGKSSFYLCGHLLFSSHIFNIKNNFLIIMFPYLPLGILRQRDAKLTFGTLHISAHVWKKNSLYLSLFHDLSNTAIFRKKKMDDYDSTPYPVNFQSPIHISASM